MQRFVYNSKLKHSVWSTEKCLPCRECEKVTTQGSSPHEQQCNIDYVSDVSVWPSYGSFLRLDKVVGHNPVIGLLLTMADVSTIMLHLLMRLLASNLFHNVTNVAQSGYNFYIKECLFFFPSFS